MEDIKLYQYTEDFQSLLNYMEENDISYEDMVDTIEAIQLSAEDKIKNTGKVILKLSDDVEKAKAQEKRINELRKKDEKKIENLKQYLLFNMQQLKLKKVEDSTIRVSTRNNTSMNIIDPEKLPKEFIKEVVETKPDKQGFTKYYKSLSEEEKLKIDYAHLETNQSLQIK